MCLAEHFSASKKIIICNQTILSVIADDSETSVMHAVTEDARPRDDTGICRFWRWHKRGDTSLSCMICNNLTWGSTYRNNKQVLFTCCINWECISGGMEDADVKPWRPTSSVTQLEHRGHVHNGVRKRLKHLWKRKQTRRGRMQNAEQWKAKVAKESLKMTNQKITS